jgi:hypothetical protein
MYTGPRPLADVKLPGALRRSFLREEACASFARAGAAVPKSPALRQSKGLHLIPTARR